jgi:predicted alpha/beta-fold hydrolase
LRVAVEAVVGWCRGAGSASESPLTPSPSPGGRGEQEGSTSESPITLFGMSLSGNILLKYLGEAGTTVPRSVRAALVANPPIDLSRSVRTLTRPLNRGYDRHFTKLLIEHVRRQTELRPDFAPLPRVLPKSLYDFDDRYTAPQGGYADAEEYYAAASAISRVSSITLPTTIVTTADDPLVPVEMFLEPAVSWPSAVQRIITPGGGHLGYVSHGSADPDNRWLDWRVVEFATGNHVPETVWPPSPPGRGAGGEGT